jgi:hypothetical protein
MSLSDAQVRATVAVSDITTAAAYWIDLERMPGGLAIPSHDTRPAGHGEPAILWRRVGTHAVLDSP